MVNRGLCARDRQRLWTTMLIRYFVLTIGVILATYNTHASAAESTPPQAVAGQEARSGGAIPLAHLYWHFLMYQNHLDRSAALLERQGKNGGWLRNHYQQQLGLSDAEFKILRATAARLELKLNAIDARVTEVVGAYHAAHPHILKEPGEAPPVPPELLSLRDEHESVINSEVGNLRTALGSSATVKVDKFLQQDFAAHVTIRRIGPPPKNSEAPHEPLPSRSQQ